MYIIRSQKPREHPLGREKQSGEERGILRSADVGYELDLLQKIRGEIEIPFKYTFGSGSVLL